MSKYIEQECPFCKVKTWHRRIRHFGMSDKKDGRKHIKRIVTRCCECGYRIIDNARFGKKRTQILSFR